MIKYKQITQEERYIMAALRKQGLSIRAVANYLGRHHSTIYREFTRNTYHADGCYRPSKAQEKTIARRRRSKRNKQYTEEVLKPVWKLLKAKYSPEQITGHIQRFNLMERTPSHETIYQYIWEDKSQGGFLWQHLRQSSKRRRKRYRAYDSRGILADKRHISERPKSVESKKYIGHWEIDTVHGKGSNHCIVTILERKTGFVLIGNLNDKTTQSLNQKTNMLINRMSSIFKTITSDNGTEFHQYKIIEEKHSVKFYFANPYHSWERGANENVNGLIRQYLPKGTSMQHLTQKKCDWIAKQLNSRPRKRYNFKTPEELIHDYL